MVGVGPFITIPLIIASMGGPQCMLGWVLGAIIALCDGLVWSELAASMPATGGTYVYLREAFRTTSLGGILPFLFIWQFIFSGPLEIASGYIGFAQYVGYFWRGMGTGATRAVSMSVGVLVIVLLYRRVTSIGKLTVVLWIGMLITVLWVIFAGLTHFNAKVVFDFPPNAFRFSTGFVAGLGSATLIAIYDFMGYYDICYVAGEVRNPGARDSPFDHLFRAGGRGDLCADESRPDRGGAVARGGAFEIHRVGFHGEALWNARRIGRHRAGIVDRARVGVRAAVRIQPDSLRGGAERRLLQSLRAPASHGGFPAHLAAGDGRTLDRRVFVDPGRCDYGAGHFANYYPVHRADFRARVFKEAAAGNAAAVSDVALSAALRDRFRGLGVPVSDVRVEVRGVRGADIGGRNWGILDLDPEPP